MVREAVSAPASEAREAGLIDVVAADERQLLRRVDGFELKGPKGQTLRTEGLRVERHDTPLHYELLQTLVDPTIASLLLLIGAAGIAIEILSPGAIAPGVAGAIALILGLYGSALLPVTAAGVALLLLALGLIAAETQIPSGGILGGAGVAALVAGLLVLYDTDSEALRVSVPAAVAAGVLLGGLVLFAASKGLAARKAPPRGEAGDLVGASGVVRAPLDPVGQVLVSGALWRAKTAEERGVPRGARVEVRSVDGLTLTVQPEDNHEQQRSDT
jgi:membrane-bound serine protease (ClpP class)